MQWLLNSIKRDIENIINNLWIYIKIISIIDRPFGFLLNPIYFINLIFI